jgi:AmmeMemoRadiSam system protein A
MGLTETDKQVLIDIAKKTIECKIKKEEVPEFKIASKTLKEKRGAFVTLKKDGSLRGCIGYVEAKKPLHKTVEEMAVASAFNDPRFPPLRQDELKHLTIEISVLTPLKQIKDIEEIEVGVHGIYITRDFHSGLLLPQVANEYQWDRLTFLEESCYKANLSSNAWTDKNTKIYIFTADVFGQHW